jgi:hypothetical protein
MYDEQTRNERNQHRNAILRKAQDKIAAIGEDSPELLEVRETRADHARVSRGAYHVSIEFSEVGYGAYLPSVVRVKYTKIANTANTGERRVTRSFGMKHGDFNVAGVTKAIIEGLDAEAELRAHRLQRSSHRREQREALIDRRNAAKELELELEAHGIEGLRVSVDSDATRLELKGDIAALVAALKKLNA